MAKNKKKVKTNLDIMQEIRGTWGNINPVTRVHGTQKGYDRKKEKRNIQRDLDHHRIIKIA